VERLNRGLTDAESYWSMCSPYIFARYDYAFGA
jgi:hypothetical protein